MDNTFIDTLTETLKQLDARLGALEHSVNDVIIGSLKTASDEYAYEDGLEQFRGTYTDLAEIEPQLKALRGEDYDAYKSLYDSAREHENEEGYDEEAFVKATIEELKERFRDYDNLAKDLAEAAEEVAEEDKVEDAEHSDEEHNDEEAPAAEEPSEEAKDVEEGEEDSEDFPDEEQLARELAAVL